MREVLAEVLFLTDIIEDNHLESNQEVLEELVDNYSQLLELAVSRGLVGGQETLE